jgi:hypothetical protein
VGVIAGRVMRAQDGGSAEGADVILLLPPPKGQNYYTVAYPLRRVTSDANGTFSFDGLEPGRYRVWSNLGKLTSRRKRSEARVVVIPESGPAPPPIELRLVTGAAVRARVKDKATGKPIAGATVHIGWTGLPADPTTDHEGNALVQPLPAEVHTVEAWADGYAREEQSINLENGSDADLEFPLGPGGDLEGVVRDPYGKALADVGLSVRRAGHYLQIAYVTTDDDGRYRLAHLPRGAELEIDVSKTDYGRKQLSAKVTTARAALDITLEPRPDGGSVAGVVLDHQKQPIAGAEVTNMGGSSSDVRKTKTGPDGRFRLDNLYEDSNLGKEVVVRAAGAAPKRVKVSTGPRDRPVETTITLDPGHRIRGRVVADDGKPLDGVRVAFAHGDSPFSDGGATTTGPDGQFTFDTLPADAPFSFRKGGYSGISERPLPLDTDQVVSVTMVPAGLIAGRISDAKTGAPIRAFNVRITFSRKRQPGEPSTALLSSLVDPGQNYQSEEGLFQLGDLVVGMPLQVTVAAPGYEHSVAERVVVAHPGAVQADAYRLEPLDPAALRTYGGRLLDDQGKPVAGAQIRLIAARGRNADRRQNFPFNWMMIENGQLARQPEVTRFLETATQSDGRFVFLQVPTTDEVELAWWGTGVVPGRRDHLERLTDADKAAIDIVMPRPARIVGTLDRASLPGAVRAEVHSTGFGLPGAELELKPDQREFEIGALAAGECWVSVVGPYERIDSRGGMTARPLGSQKVTLQPGETRRVEFRK